jgi:hypothetical protein
MRVIMLEIIYVSPQFINNEPNINVVTINVSG